VNSTRNSFIQDKLNYSSVLSTKSNQNEISLFKEVLIQCSIESVKIEFSTKDVQRILFISQKQIAKLTNKEKLPNLETLHKSLPNVSPTVQCLSFELSFSDKIEIDFVNDFQGVMCKNFKIELSNIKMKVDLNEHSEWMAVCCLFRSDYFNGNILRWEPLIEEFPIGLEMNSFEEDQKQQLDQILEEKVLEESKLKSSSNNLQEIKELESQKSIWQEKISLLQDSLMDIPDSTSKKNTKQRRVYKLLPGLVWNEHFNRIEIKNICLNINVSLEMLKQVKLMLNHFQEVVRSEYSSESKLEPPLKIINETGFPLEIDYYIEKYYMTHNIKLRKEELFRVHKQINKDEVKNIFELNQQIYEQSINGVNKENEVTFVENLKITILESQQTTNKPSAYKTIQLKPKMQKRLVLNKKELLLTIKSDSNKKEILISSSLCVTNKIPESLLNKRELILHVNSRFGNHQFVLSSSEHKFVPVDIRKGKLEVSIDTVQMVLKFKRTLSDTSQDTNNQIVVKIYELTSSEEALSEYYALRYLTSPINCFLQNIEIVPSLQIRNCCPFDCYLLLTDTSKTKIVHLKKGQSISSSQFSPESNK
jgi:hypothetical protein